MKTNKIIKNFLIVTVFVLSFGGCTKKKGIREYSEELQINFPEDMNLAYYHTNSDFQDYSIESTYSLSFNQKNSLLEEIHFKTCDSNGEKDRRYSCWHNCEDYYSFEYHNKDDGVIIKIVFIARKDIRMLTIREIKI